MSDWTLQEVDDVQIFKGYRLPATASTRWLIITGPPGCGKSTEINNLGGWPEEGFLDLTESRWWRSPVLRFCPRQVHLGLPFRGHAKALTLFDEEWLRAKPHPHLNLSRIYLPPSDKWRDRYVFGFLLPSAEEVFAARSERAYRQSHLVDVKLSLERVAAELDTYHRVALQLHRAGLKIFVRDEYGGPPKVFETEMRTIRSPWDSEPPPQRPLIGRMLEMLAGTSSPPIIENLEETHLHGKQMRIPIELLPVELSLGPQKLCMFSEFPLDDSDHPVTPNLLIFDPEQYADQISGFVRLQSGGRIRIGKGEADRLITPRLPTNISSRLSISYDGTLITLADLHSPSGTIVAPAAGSQTTNPLRKGVRERRTRIAHILGAPVEQWPAEEALANLRDVNQRLKSQRFRPSDDRGHPGGLVELPVEVTPVIVGDLHGNLDNLLSVLSANRFLDELEQGTASVILLGDAVHLEEGDLEDMEDSIAMMDVLLRFMQVFPEHFIYLRGNHDSFSQEIMKGGVQQGRVWRKRLMEVRGPEYVQELQLFYDRLPLVATSDDFVACHGGPPLGRVSRKRLINLYRHPTLSHQLSWNRLQKASNPAGYTNREIRALKQAVGLRRSDPLIVSHTPKHGSDTVWLDHGGIQGHHIVHSANRRNVAVFSRICGEIAPLVYPVQRLVEWKVDGV